MAIFWILHSLIQTLEVCLDMRMSREYDKLQVSKNNRNRIVLELRQKPLISTPYSVSKRSIFLSTIKESVQLNSLIILHHCYQQRNFCSIHKAKYTMTGSISGLSPFNSPLSTPQSLESERKIINARIDENRCLLSGLIRD